MGEYRLDETTVPGFEPDHALTIANFILREQKAEGYILFIS